MARKCAVPPYDRTSPEQDYIAVFNLIVKIKFH
jgi:hypothetical protein